MQQLSSATCPPSSLAITAGGHAPPDGGALPPYDFPDRGGGAWQDRGLHRSSRRENRATINPERWPVPEAETIH